MPDYKTIARGDSTGTAPDYTKFVKKADPGGGILPVPGVPEVPEQVEARVRAYLVNSRGYDPAAVDTLFTPGSQLPTTIDTGALWRDLDQFVADPANIPVREETDKFVAQLGAEGLNLSGIDRENLFDGLANLGAGNIEGMAEARGWWTDVKRQLANQAAESVSGGAANLTLGLSLLDIFERFDRSVKLSTIGIGPIARKLGIEKKRHDFENEVLPSVVLGEGPDKREFGTGTSAALWLLGQKALGAAQELGGLGTGAAGLLVKLHGNEPLGELLQTTGQEMAQAGEERGGFVAGQIPPLVAGLGRPLPWLEVVERGWNAEEEFDSLYKFLDDHGDYGQQAMIALAFQSAALDLVASPANLIGVSLSKLPALGRVALKGTAKAAEITGDVARTTHRLEDAIDAVRAAESHFTGMDAQVTRAVSESVGATGKPAVPSNLYRRWILARRHLNNHKAFLDGFREPQIDEVMLRSAPRRDPKLLPAPKDTPIAKEMHRARAKVLERGADAPLDWSKGDMPGLRQRQVLGPDDAEVSGDALNMIVRSGGLSVDDVTVLPVAPEYYVTPAQGPIPTIPWRNLDLADDVTRAERNFLTSITRGLPETPGQPVYDLETSSHRMLVRAEDVIRRNLGVSRSLGDKAKVKLYEGHLDLNRTAQKAVKGVKKAGQYDDIWLPPDQPSVMSTPERFNNWLKTAGDRVVRSLYPGGLRVGYWHSAMGRIHNQVREPQRFFEVWDPEAWNTIRSARLRYDQSVDAWNDMVVKTAEVAGVIKHRDKFNPLKHWAPYTIDKEKDELLFNLLNVVKGSDEFAKLKADPKYTPALLATHDRVRRALDVAADSQGIKDSDRFLEGYILHFFDKAQFKGGSRPIEYMGVPRGVELWARHLQERRGNEGYMKSAMQALEIYGRSMPRKTILEPMYEDIIQRGSDLARKMDNPAIQTYVNDYVSTLQGRPTMLGHAIDEWIGGALNAKGKPRWNPGEVDRKLMGLTSALYAGILTGNPRYPFMQIATAIPTTAMRFGLFRTAKGLFQMATQEGQALTKAMGVYKPFLDIFESPAWQRMARLATETIPTVTPFGAMTNAGAERAIRGLTAWAAIDTYLTKFGFATWDEAVQAGWGRSVAFNALRASEEVNHMFGAHGRSPFLLRKLGGSQGFTVAATQFLSFTWKQTDELISNIGRGGAEGLGRLGEYFAVSGWVSHVAAQHLGIDATNYVGLGYLPEEPDEMTSPAVDMLFKLVELGAAHSSHDPQRIQRSTRELMDSMDNFAPLMGGFETASRGAERLITGELTTAGGEKLRGMDFAPEIPEDLRELTPGDIARSIRPGTEPEGLGGELIPTLTGQQSIRERLFRRGQRALQQERKRFFHNMRTAIDDYVRAAEDGDVEAEDRLATELENTYRIRLSGTSAIERAVEARQISWALRQVDPGLGGDAQLMDRYVKILRDFGIGLEP